MIQLPPTKLGRVYSNFFDFQDRIEEHRETFDPNNIRDYIDEFLSEQKKEKEMGQTEHLSGTESPVLRIFFQHATFFTVFKIRKPKHNPDNNFFMKVMWIFNLT